MVQDQWIRGGGVVLTLSVGMRSQTVKSHWFREAARYDQCL